MRENAKFIVGEVNKLLARNYNIIVFNALSPEELLQVLKEVLTKVQNENDAGVSTAEQTSIYVLSVLRVLNYQPQTDPATFRQGLIRGDPETIYPILTWLLSHVDVVRKRAYLARFLVKVEIPVEYLGDSEVSSLHEQYAALIDRFKAAHKEREIGKKNVESASELTADLQTMEKEKEAVSIRIEKMKRKAESGIDLLDAARELRVERDKERDLGLQKEQEKESLARLQVSLQRMERDVETLRKDEGNKTAQDVLQHLSEAVTVQTIVTNEKLPSELAERGNRMRALTAVKRNTFFGPDQITALRGRLDAIAKEIQELAELKISRSNADRMEPFRRQAGAVASVKRGALERLEAAERSSAVLDARLETMSREAARRAAEEQAPRGEELKRYVARLKARSSLYKNSKGELAGLTAENSVLQRTVGVLENRLSQCAETKRMLEPMRKSTPSNLTAENAQSMNVELSRSICALRAKLAPVINEVQTLRQKASEYEDRFQTASKSHTAIESSMNNSIGNLLLETQEMKAKIEQDTKEKERVQALLNKMKNIEERINNHAQDHLTGDPSTKLKEELNGEILSEELNVKSLTRERENIKENIMLNEKQTQMWNNIISIFACKLQCAEENKQTNGIVMRRGGAETLVLQ